MDKDEKIALIERKEEQIIRILADENITFEMTKSILQRVEVKFLDARETLLNNSIFKNVLYPETEQHKDITG